jgi:hypothetical protein
MSSDEPYDESDTDSELDMEELTAPQGRQRVHGLPLEEVEHALDALVAEYELQWQKEHLPALNSEASSRWKHLCGMNRYRAFQKVKRRVEHLDKRIRDLRNQLLSIQTFHDIAELRRCAATLQPSIYDRLQARWKIGLLQHANPPQDGPAEFRPHTQPEPGVDLESSDSDHDIEDVDHDGWRRRTRQERMYRNNAADTSVSDPAIQASRERRPRTIAPSTWCHPA